ncbi:hypothetical protein GCM10025867_12860 [Frondihabitans sucicola]|uniref:Amino acid transporter n=1 Tax=Frondihabitans sucicola TaxID=1268041 RepID=A0ABN6XVK1_9MICO|nr:hypothetical protein GCM10025867_12860 [Frondihabitans sucicola]
MTATVLPALVGFLTGLSLIVAIGAQNAFVLRLGIEGRSRVIAPVVVICAASDGVLIVAGVLGIGALIQAAPVVMIVIRIVGAGFLLVYGLSAARRALRPAALVAAAASSPTGVRTAVITALAFTWLNPHVYLDTVLFLGSVANQQGLDERWWWAGEPCSRAASGSPASVSVRACSARCSLAPPPGALSTPSSPSS